MSRSRAHIVRDVFLVLMVLSFAATSRAAEDQPPTAESRHLLTPAVLQHIRQASGELNLDADQKARVDALLDETQKKIEPFLANLRSGDADARQQVDQAIRPVAVGMRQILLPEQMQQLQKLMQGSVGRGNTPTTRPAQTAGPMISKADLAALKPLTEMGEAKYKGFGGGLYSDGTNQRPAAHDAAGLALARQIQPLDADGKPSPEGKIVLVSQGMSNTTMEFSVFKRIADADPKKNPKLVIVDGAQGRQTAGRTQQDKEGAGKTYWEVVDQRLKAARVTPAQVQVFWMKQADGHPQDGFPKYAQTLQEELANIARLIHVRYPNVKQLFLSSRTYGGYATSALNPEPYAFEGGYSVKWLIEQQIKGEPSLNYDPAKGKVKAPWMAWGPYLWASATKRADGFSYEFDDVVEKDRTHPSESGRQKVAMLLLEFFKTDTAARAWFIGD